MHGYPMSEFLPLVSRFGDSDPGGRVVGQRELVESSQEFVYQRESYSNIFEKFALLFASPRLLNLYMALVLC